MLITMWQKICTDLEDCRSGSVVTSVDYAKAFNRLSFQECLWSLAKKAASTDLLAILASFLTNCTMSIRMEQDWSPPLLVFGGVPQGSILGVFLFNATTDNLEDGMGMDDQAGEAMITMESPHASDWGRTVRVPLDHPHGR